MDFDICYTKQSSLDDDNKEIRYKIEGKSKLCSPLSLSCHEEDGCYGIWLDWPTCHFLINPVDLFNTIFAKSDGLYIHKIASKGGIQNKKFNIEVYRESCVFAWGLLSPIAPAYSRMYYRLDNYVDTIHAVITELDVKIKSGLLTAYDNIELKPDAVHMCVEQFKIKSVFPSYYKRMAADIKVEEFVFEPTNSESYTIGVGNRTFNTFFTHWDGDMEYVRHQLENIAFTRKTTINLSFDASDTIVDLSIENIIDHTEECGAGIAFRYNYFMHVQIQSNSFVDMPVISGYCDIKQVLVALYEGLLRMALMHPRVYYLHDDAPSQLTAYNIYKSPLIEARIKGNRNDDTNKYEERQVHIKDVLTINPDYDVFLTDLEGCAYDYKDIDGLCKMPVKIDGLAEWCSEIKPVVIEAAVGRTYPMDWENYHKRGLELAHKLRNVLPKEYDLWYKAPFEDKSCIIPKPHLVI